LEPAQVIQIRQTDASVVIEFGVVLLHGIKHGILLVHYQKNASNRIIHETPDRGARRIVLLFD
jgi:hypothetical protein